ncbi:MAG: bleomycin resistance protein [Segetibacter sp.]|nr:bleomycin resistance protein [Segetibacter sp.]
MNVSNKAFFAPQLYIKSGITDISFYEKALGAIELRRFTNDDGSIHVVELSIDGAIFHMHEETLNPGQFSPQKFNGTTVLIGLFVSDVDSVMAKAIRAGAVIVSPTQSYDYGYRQGEFKDPFGHIWMIEMKI